MIGTRTAPFGRPDTRLHVGRIALVLLLLVGVFVAAWIWLFHKDWTGAKVTPDSGTVPSWTAAQMHYGTPEPKPEPLLPAPVDTVGPQIAKILAMLAAMDGRMTGIEGRLKDLENRKPPPPPPAPKAAVVQKAPAPLLFVQHDLKDVAPSVSKIAEYTLAPGGKLPCVIETAINSDVEGYFLAKVSTNTYDTATGSHLLVPQGSAILGRDHSQDLLYGNERLPTTSLTLTLPDGRVVDLGKAPVTDQQGIAGLTGRVNNHFGRMLAAVLIGGTLRAGTQALQVGLSNAAGAGPVAAGYSSVLNQAVSPRIGRALDTRPTIEIDAGQICNVLLLKPLSLPAMWQ
jgi:hypothetical protein